VAGFAALAQQVFPVLGDDQLFASAIARICVAPH
jgi:hypothetical protein